MIEVAERIRIRIQTLNRGAGFRLDAAFKGNPFQHLSNTENETISDFRCRFDVFKDDKRADSGRGGP